MARLQRRLTAFGRHRLAARAVRALPLVEGDFPGVQMSRIARARGVVVREHGQFYLVRGSKVGEPPVESNAGEIAREVGIRLKTPLGLESGQALSSGESRAGRNEWRIGEARFNRNFELVAAAMLLPVALVVCRRNPAHIYPARQYKACPLDGALLDRLERP